MRNPGLLNTENELTALFALQAPAPRRGFPPFAISTTLHGAVIAMVSWALIHSPTVVQNPIDRQYKVRQLDFHVPETAASRAAEALYPKKDSEPQTQTKPDQKQALKSPARGAAESAKAEPRPRAVPAVRLPQGGKGEQILVQPQIRSHQLLAQETPVPSVLIWTPERKQVLKIVPPAPDQVTTADIQTSLQIPNEELHLADLPATPAKNPPQVQTPPAGNTSPVAVQGPAAAKIPPATVSTPSDQPTPTTVLSISDLRMKEGTAELPPVNETRGNSKTDGASQQAVKGSVLTAHPAADGDNGSGGNGNGASGKGAAGTAIADAQSAAPDASAAGETAQHIQLPKDGRFAVVVVGSSLSDQYPEALQIWSDRVAYTAYLHVGTQKAWILQYAQLRSADAATGGSVAKLEAPWPYDILRPDTLAKDLNADALMVHGILNESGRLQNLAIAYPQGYVHSSFILRELGQWQFRPARQLGKPTAVEVLLIIPEEDD